MEDINQLELLAYIIVIGKEITIYSEKTIDNYIDLLEEEILKTPKNTILIKANTKLYDKIVPRHKLNLEECINYAILIFHCLLADPLKTFDNQRIIEATKYIYNKFSVRTAKEEIAKLGIITHK